MNQEILKEYSELRKQKEALEERIAELGAAVMGMLQKEGIDKAESEYGTFSVISIPRWSYTEAVKTEESRIKELKKREREEGKAERQATTSLRYQA